MGGKEAPKEGEEEDVSQEEQTAKEKEDVWFSHHWMIFSPLTNLFHPKKRQRDFLGDFSQRYSTALVQEENPFQDVSAMPPAVPI